MKVKFLSKLTAALVLFLGACDPNYIRPFNKVTTEEINVNDFHKIKASGQFQVYVTFTDSENSLSITANENLHDYIDVKVVDGELSIGLIGNQVVRGNGVLEAYVAVGSLSKIDLDGNSYVQLENTLEQDNVDFFLNGQSKLVGSIDVNKAEIRLNGNAEMDVDGVADKVSADMNGLSELKSYDLNIEDLRINMNGMSSSYLTVDGTIGVSAYGVCALHYKGKAVVNSKNLYGVSRLLNEG